MSTISVIVPVYKVEKYIHRCVDSILGQTYTDFELILVDDGSPDNCGTICDEYAAKDNRVVVIHQENGGHGQAVNTGLKNATGIYFKVLDSDDWFDKDALLKVAKELKALQKHNQYVDMFVANYVYECIVRVSSTVKDDGAVG